MFIAIIVTTILLFLLIALILHFLPFLLFTVHIKLSFYTILMALNVPLRNYSL